MSPGRRGLEHLLADLAEAIDAAAELVTLGKQRWDSERSLRLAKQCPDTVPGSRRTKPVAIATGRARGDKEVYEQDHIRDGDQ